MGSSDRVVGGALMGIAVAVWVYYTTWTLVVPFMEEGSSSLTEFFPPQIYAVAVPSLLLVLLLLGVGAFIGLTVMKASLAKAKKEKSKES